MNRETIGLAQWLDTPPGRCLLQWESQQFDEALADTFGYHALQLGLPPLQALRSNRMPHQWLAAGGGFAGGPSCARRCNGCRGCRRGLKDGLAHSLGRTAFW
jgi:hypothetical protein